MTDYEYLIHLIYCAVHDTASSEKPEEVSFQRVLEIGKEHEVANIAFLSVDKLQNKPDDDVYEDWKLAYYFAVQRDMRQQLLYEDIVEMLHQNQIRTLEAQGTVTKTLYPSPEWRMMSDIDYIVDFENYPAIESLFREKGCDVWQTQPDEMNTMVDGMEIEFHCDFFTKEMYRKRQRYYDAINHAFSHAVPSPQEPLKYLLDDTFFYLYSVLHTIKHFEISGCGIRRVLDLYYLKKAFATTVDNEYIQRVIDDYAFRDSFEKLMALEAYWFENKTPAFDLTDVICDVIQSGNHGTNEIFVRNNVRNEIKSGGRFTKLRYMMGFLFPDISYLYAMYPECAERGYSLNRARWYRIGKKVKKLRFRHALTYLKTVMNSDKK